MNPELQAIVRNLGQLASGYLVAHGLASTDQSSALVGGVVALVVIVWSLVDKGQARKNVAVALATPTPPTAAEVAAVTQ